MNAIPTLPDLELIEKVGEGGTSTVWKALDAKRGEVVAVKILKREFTASEDDIELFREEARTMSRINHIGIVRSYALNFHEGTWYYTMEYVDGYNFGELLNRKQHLSEADCLLICESIAVALDYAWNDFGVVHCDIKPENIMINSDGIVKLTDLGLCHTFQYLADGMQDVPEHVMGTPAYIPPEQIFGDTEPDCRNDIYSLAASLYHLSTGRVLFPGLSADEMMRAHCDDTKQARDPRFYRPELSEGFCQLLEAMLVKNRDYRISSWSNICEMCLAIEQGVAFKPRRGTPSSMQITLSCGESGGDTSETTGVIPDTNPVPRPKKNVMHFFVRGKRKHEPQLQVDEKSGKKVLKKLPKAANSGFKIHTPADW